MVLVANDRNLTQNWLSKKGGIYQLSYFRSLEVSGMAGSRAHQSLNASLTQLYFPLCCLYSQASSSHEVPAAPAIPLAASSYVSPVERERCFSNSSWKKLGEDSNWTDWGHMPNPEPISEDLGKWNELIGQTWLQCLPVEWEVRSVLPSPHKERKNSSTEENQELELEKGVGAHQALQWASAHCWSRLTSPHSEMRGLDPKIPLLPSLGKEREPARFSLSQSFHFSN